MIGATRGCHVASSRWGKRRADASLASAMTSAKPGFELGLKLPAGQPVWWVPHPSPGKISPLETDFREARP